MAIQFNKLKSPRLSLLDRLPFGKFQDCRVCDIVPENYEYVLWLHNKSPQLFTKEVVDSAQTFKREAASEQHQREEIDPYLKSVSPWLSDWDDDIPF
jgi:hypothetical protein